MIYVIIQFGAIFFLIYYSDLDAINLISGLLLLIAGLIGLKAVYDMKLSNLNILPELKEKHQLVTSGIYSQIRHPMYTAVLLFCLGLVFTKLDITSGIVYFILCVDLYLKSQKEEGYLTKRFDNYVQYRTKTVRFLPFF